VLLTLALSRRRFLFAAAAVGLLLAGGAAAVTAPGEAGPVEPSPTVTVPLDPEPEPPQSVVLPELPPEPAPPLAPPRPPPHVTPTPRPAPPVDPQPQPERQSQPQPESDTQPATRAEPSSEPRRRVQEESKPNATPRRFPPATFELGATAGSALIGYATQLRKLAAKPRPAAVKSRGTDGARLQATDVDRFLPPVAAADLGTARGPEGHVVPLALLVILAAGLILVGALGPDRAFALAGVAHRDQMRWLAMGLGIAIMVSGLVVLLASP
jgi:hypothetical protein